MTVQTEKPNATDPALSWSRYEPDARRPWNLALAGHLYRRAGFGADWGQLQAALADGPQGTVDKLLRPPDGIDAFNRAALVGNNMVEEGNTEQEAETAIDLLITAVKTAGHARLSIDTHEGRTRATLELKPRLP